MVLSGVSSVGFVYNSALSSKDSYSLQLLTWRAERFVRFQRSFDHGTFPPPPLVVLLIDLV